MCKGLALTTCKCIKQTPPDNGKCVSVGRLLIAGDINQLAQKTHLPVIHIANKISNVHFLLGPTCSTDNISVCRS